MKRIILISCVNKKLEQKAKAKDLYSSPLFKKSLQYAYSLQPDKIFILSAKYGLVSLDEEIAPYNETLNKFSSEQIKNRAKGVLEQLQNITDLSTDQFVFLAGNNYRKFLLPNIKNYEIPMLGLPIGKQLKWLTEKNENI